MMDKRMSYEEYLADPLIKEQRQRLYPQLA